MGQTEELLALPVDERLRAFDPWLHTVAWALLPWPFAKDYEDIVQEGRIAAWKAMLSYDGKGALPAWVTRCAKSRMVDIAYQRKPSLGHEPLRGHWEPKNPTPIEEDDQTPDPAQQDALEAVERASMAGDVRAAMARLTPEQREYVVLRFWGGVPLGDTSGAPAREQVADLAPRFAEKSARKNAWTQGARPVLMESLAHLVDDVRDGWG